MCRCDLGAGEPNRETSASTGYTLKRWQIIQKNIKRSTTNLFNVTDVLICSSQNIQTEYTEHKVLNASFYMQRPSLCYSGSVVRFRALLVI